MNNEYLKNKIAQINKDDYQKLAYEHMGNTVVLAGPGSGKTTILTLKIMRLLQEEIIEPRGLACLTYSNEAAREFKDRLYLMGFRKRKNVFLGTVHSFCLSEIIGQFSSVYNLDIPLPIRIITDNNKKRLVIDAAKQLGIEESYNLLNRMDVTRQLRISGKSGITVSIDPEMDALANKYEELLYSSGYIDYEAIIIESTNLLQKYPYIRECINAKYPWILIDEYQDLGKPLHEMVITMIDNSDMHFFAVGDPDQSIYGFQGAVPEYLVELSERKDVKKIHLINNYRSNQDIIDGSELMLPKTRGYVAKTRQHEEAIYEFISLEDEMDAQYDFFVENIIPRCQEEKIPLDEIAVLLSNNTECASLAQKCKLANIPYYIVRHSFNRSDFVKWLELCAFWIDGNRDVEFKEIYEYWKNLLLIHDEDLFFSANDDILEKRHLLNTLESSKRFSYSAREWFLFLRNELNIDEIIKNNDYLPDEVNNLNKLYSELSGEEYNDYGVNRFCKIGKPENQVIISTRHSSKGLEFEVVVMMGMEDGRFPNTYRKSQKEIDEFDRLCFVCISRAKRVCILMKSKYHTIPKKDGSTWKKAYLPSKYWTSLYDKYAEKSIWFREI